MPLCLSYVSAAAGTKGKKDTADPKDGEAGEGMHLPKLGHHARACERLDAA